MKVGIAVKDLGASHLSYCMIREVNALLHLNPTLDVIAFYEDHQRPALPMHFAAMSMHELWGFEGPTIATTLSTVQRALACPGPRPVLFYLWDLEWLRLPAPRRYRPLADLYRDSRLMIVARAADHARAFEEAWNRPVAGVAEEFCLQKLYEVIGQCLRPS